MKTKDTLAATDFPATVTELLELRAWVYFRESKLGNDLFISDPDRADRIHEAAEHGCDGSTHAECMEDWREFMETLESDFSSQAWGMDDEMEADAFTEAWEARRDALAEEIDACEAWHAKNGSLHSEVG
jgi:hypothetical protein